MPDVIYTIKRARVTKDPVQYHNLDAMLAALREILEAREKSGFLGKVWLTVEAKYAPEEPQHEELVEGVIYKRVRGVLKPVFKPYRVGDTFSP